MQLAGAIERDGIDAAAKAKPGNDFAEEPQTTAPGRVFGVGVAQGRHPALGRNRVYVVLMVGHPAQVASEANAPPP